MRVETEQRYFDSLTSEQQYAATHFGHQSNWISADKIRKLEKTFKMAGVWLTKDGKIHSVLSVAIF